MTTIKEDYVSFETAKLLKEKGFNAEIDTYYSPEGKFKIWCPNGLKSYLDNKGTETWWWKCIAPTLQMAIKWLREVHKISIEITSTGYLIDNDVEWECDIKVGLRLYFKHITNEKSFESCANKALEYCLEYLI